MCEKAITKRWYKAEPPTQNEGLKMVIKIYDMELETERIRAQEERCREKWEKRTMFICQRQDKKLNH